MKKAYFYPNTELPHCLTTHKHTALAHKQGLSYHTTQMSFLKNAWWDGYEVYILNSKSKFVKICNESNLTAKELRHSHNIFKIWEAGGFNI